jgi:prolyl 4-hydroxylase
MGFTFEIIDNFIDSCDSEYITDHYRDKLTPSCVIGDMSLRNSDDFFIDSHNILDTKLSEIINNIKIKISDFSNLPLENQETLTLIKYSPGQYFKPHLDAFQNYDEFDIEDLLGGQRLKTFIICLKSSVRGGETKFDRIDKSVKLQQGQCIWWENVNELGDIYYDSLHSGETPIEGDKWILTCWIRQRKYYPISRDFAKQIIEKYSKQILINTLENLKK